MKYFLNTFHMKARLSQSLLPDMELVKNVPIILDIKNANRVQNFFFIIVPKIE